MKSKSDIECKEAEDVTITKDSLQRLVRHDGGIKIGDEDNDVWERLEKFSVLIRKVHQDMRSTMSDGSEQDFREAILLAASGCRVIREACQQLASSDNDQKIECHPAPTKDSEWPIQGCQQHHKEKRLVV